MLQEVGSESEIIDNSTCSLVKRPDLVSQGCVRHYTGYTNRHYSYVERIAASLLTE